MTTKHRNRVRRNVLAATLAAALGLGSLAASAASIEIDALDATQSYTRLIVKYRDTNTMRGADMASRLATVSRAANVQLEHVRKLAIGADLIEIGGGARDAFATLQLMEEFARQPDVEYVEPDRIMKPTFSPNDTRYGEQWHYFDSVAGLNLPGAWDIATGSGVTVAVIDTGITPHADLNANIVAGYDFISDSASARDGNGRDSNPNDEGDWFGVNECGVPYSSGSSWHGTHVAGTIAAVTNNASGVAGVAFGAKVQPVRVLGKCGGSVSDIADAIVWASGGSVSGVPANSTPAKVINMSLGGSGSCGSTFQNAINSAVGRGTVVVIAAGNDNANVSGYSPGNCSNVVTVAASDKEGNRAQYSNYGSLIDVTAPGGETTTTSKGVLSTLNTGSTTQGSATYAFYQGTSMAAPHVAGVAALILSKGSKTPAEVESLLKANTRPLAGSCSGGCGAGLVDATKVMQAVTGGGGGGGGGSVLQNGVAVTGLGATTGNSLNYTLAVPAGASNLTFTMSGGSGDADLYVKFGSAPTDSSYDCRPYKAGNAETCTFASPGTGTYYARVKAYTSFSGVSLVANYSTGGGGGSPQTYSNGTDVNIPDNNSTGVTSNIVVSGRSGNAGTSVPVSVDIRHTYSGDLIVDLLAPDGSVYNISNRAGGSADNIIKTVNFNLSSEALNGTWKLRVRDLAGADTGYINSWSITM